MSVLMELASGNLAKQLPKVQLSSADGETCF